MNSHFDKSSLKSYYDKDYFESGNKSGYKNYNKGFNYHKHRLRDYQRALHLMINFHPKRVLDLGCAFGYLVMALRSLGIEAYGVDISDYSINNSRTSVKPFLKVADISKLPFKDKFFDLVVSYDVLEHIPEKELPEVLEEIKRVSSKNIFFEIYTNKYLNQIFKVNDPSHVSVFNKQKWKELFKKSGFLISNRYHIPGGLYLGTEPIYLKRT